MGGGAFVFGGDSGDDSTGGYVAVDEAAGCYQGISAYVHAGEDGCHCGYDCELVNCYAGEVTVAGWVGVVGEDYVGKDPHEVADSCSLSDVHVAVGADVAADFGVSLEVGQGSDLQSFAGGDAFAYGDAVSGGQAWAEGGPGVEDAMGA